MKKQYREYLLAIIVIAIILFVIKLSFIMTTKENIYDSFAKCLTKKGAEMYGSSTCGACNQQKSLFGESFQYITYIECKGGYENSDVEKCVKENIRGYPTWIINNEKIQGVQFLDELAEKTGCELK